MEEGAGTPRAQTVGSRAGVITHFTCEEMHKIISRRRLDDECVLATLK